MLLIAAVGAFHWGLWQQIDVGECGGVGRAECPPESNIYIPAILAGVFVSLLAGWLAGTSSLGWFALLISTPFVLTTKAFVDRDSGDRSGLLVGAGVIVVLMLVGLVLIVRMGGRAAADQKLIDSGSPARAHLVSVESTGTEINHDPRVQMTLRLEPLDGTPSFEGEVARLVDRARIPRAGDVLPAYYDAADRSTWTVQLPGPAGFDAETVARFGLATPGGGTAADPDVLRITALERLAALRDSGALTESEFENEKRRLLT